MIGAAAMIAGGSVGAGLALAVAGSLRTTPDLASALARLNGSSGTEVRDSTGSPREQILRQLVGQLRADKLTAELRLLGQTPEQLVVRKLSFALLGLAFPPVLAAVMGVIGLTLPVVIPGFASLALGAALLFAPDLDVRKRALEARREMRRAVCIFLELVALERAADAGTTEALNRAADIGDGRAFSLLRDALLRARLAGIPAWQGLTELSDEIGVPELGDVADIMRVAGEDGAAVYSTLRARSTSLRGAVLTDTAAQANTASEHMIVPVAFLGIAFMALLGYPGFARILFGH